MRWRALIFCALLTSFTGCGDDTHKPSEDTECPPDTEVGIKDLILTVRVSADTIMLGETLDIQLVATNPCSASVDATFAYTCQEHFWVYDHEGRQVSDWPECRALETPFHMDPLEVRQFDMTWIVVGDVTPGLHTVVAGFSGAMEQPSPRTDPITIMILAKEERIAGS
jgi:hypothetical protein